jgi:hypothetical protein
MTDPALAMLIAEHVGLLDGATGRPNGRGTGYHLDDVLFAFVDRGGAEFRLREEVGAAALRTPDVTVSRRGPGWVLFTPRRVDAHARDRAIAWLESAWRRADAELSGLDAGRPDDGPDALGDEPEDDDEADGGDD